MIVFTILIIFSVVFYVYYKVAILKSKDVLEQKYFNGKARMCLGGFLALFAINQYGFYQTQISLFIGIVFIALGALHIIRGYKESKHYRSEWRRLNPNQ